MNPTVTQQPAFSSAFSAPTGPVPGQGDGPVLIQCMTSADAQFAGELTVEAFRGKIEWATSKRDVPHVINGMAEEMRNSSSEYHRNFIAYYEGQRAGLLTLKYKDSREPESSGGYEGVSCRGSLGLCCLGSILNESVSREKCYIDHICVSSDFRGKGIGKVLMDRADYEGRKHGCKKIYLYVAGDNRAKNLYERQGYRVVESTSGDCGIAYCATGVSEFYKMEKPL